MGDAIDLNASLEALTKAVAALQSTIEAIANFTNACTSPSSTKPGSDEHLQDWPAQH